MTEERLQLKYSRRPRLFELKRQLIDLLSFYRIRSSDLFHIDWYCFKHPEVETLRTRSFWGRMAKTKYFPLNYLGKYLSNPIMHYVKQGRYQLLPASLVFDTRSYLLHNPDVQASGMDPLIHYIRYGQHEGRLGRGTIALHTTRKACFTRLGVWPHRLDLNLQLGDLARFSGKRYAVHLHLFYLEMESLFTSYLANIPVDFDLFVSVPSTTTGLDELRKSLKKAVPLAQQIWIEQAANRGRDIAPFLLQFGSRLQQYDAVAHIHSKKSPHALKLQDWCDQILRQLMGSPELVAHIFDLLTDDGKIVYAGPHPKIRLDQTGWGCNYEVVRALLADHPRFRLNNFPFIEFAQGTMFWARTEALQQLLALPLSINDFPAEPIAPDGTLAHALERLLLLLASEVPGRAYCLFAHSKHSIPPQYRELIEQSPQPD